MIAGLLGFLPSTNIVERKKGPKFNPKPNPNEKPNPTHCRFGAMGIAALRRESVGRYGVVWTFFFIFLSG